MEGKVGHIRFFKMRPSSSQQMGMDVFISLVSVFFGTLLFDAH